TTEPIGERLVNDSEERYVLRLYIAGLTARSTLAVERIRAICERYLFGRYELTVVDLYLQPANRNLPFSSVLDTIAEVVCCWLKIALHEIEIVGRLNKEQLGWSSFDR